MTIVLAADLFGNKLKEEIKLYLTTAGYQVEDVTNLEADFVDNTINVCNAIKDDDNKFGIMIDAYGAGPFMVASKIKGMIVAEVSDERTAHMTRAHNNARMITIGSEIVGLSLARNIVNSFCTSQYEGGRHQIRVDMLNKMC